MSASALPVTGAREHGIDLAVPADHPAFDGHFPGAPMLPGVVLVSMALEALAADPALTISLADMQRLDEVKFLAPVGPAAQLRMNVRANGPRLAVEMRCGDVTVARLQLSVLAAP